MQRGSQGITTTAKGLIALVLLGLVLLLLGWYFRETLEPTGLLRTRLSDSEIASLDSHELVRFGYFPDAVQKLHQENAGLDFGQQHFAAHLFGESLYEHAGIEGVSFCDESYTYGCYHGFFTQAIAEHGSNILIALDEACENAHTTAPSACRHGIGHGLVEYFGPNKLDDALEACNLTTRVDLTSGCPSGVFMEYNLPAEISGTTVRLTHRPLENSPFEPCLSVEDEFKESCYRELPQWWLQVFPDQHEVLVELCSQIENPQYRAHCYSGLGTVLTTEHFDYDLTRQVCGLILDDEYRQMCFNEGARSIYFITGDRDEVANFCQAPTDSVGDGLGDSVGGSARNTVTYCDPSQALP